MSSEQLGQILTSLEIPTELDPQEAIHNLSKHLVEITPTETEQQAPEVVFLELDRAGTAAPSTTIKIENLKFYWREFLMETFGTVVGISATWDKPLAMSLIGLRFLQKVKQMATAEIGQAEAQLLLEIYRLDKMKESITVDVLGQVSQGERSADEIAESLHRLEEFACIKLEMDSIELNEIIIIRNK